MSIPAAAQLKKGQMFVGGNFNYWSNKEESTDTLAQADPYSNSTSFRLNINYGYMLSDRLAFGVLAGYDKQVYESSSPYSNNQSVLYKTNYTTWSTGLFLRHFIALYEDRFFYFTQFSGSYFAGENLYTQESISVYETKNSSNGINLHLRPGFVFFINENLGLETSIGSIGYQLTNETHYNNAVQIGKSTANNFSANFSISNIYFGLNYYFGTKTSTEK